MYPRPVLYCVTDDGKYTLTKRCERVFQKPGKKGKGYAVSDKSRKQYAAIVQSYKNNPGKVADKFQTIFFNDTLADGDLVYFTPVETRDGQNGSIIKEAVHITPVAISRKADSRPMGRRFAEGFEDLHACGQGCLKDDCANCEKQLTCLKSLFERHLKGSCPACSLFGTTRYRGRLRFGFGQLINDNGPVWAIDNDKPDVDHAITLSLQESPRDTWPIPNQFAAIPGRKVYVNHHPNAVKLDKGIKPNKTNTTIEPLDAGNHFRFVIDMENLDRKSVV